jgi:hypothetical protein
MPLNTTADNFDLRLIACTVPLLAEICNTFNFPALTPPTAMGQLWLPLVTLVTEDLSLAPRLAQTPHNHNDAVVCGPAPFPVLT